MFKNYFKTALRNLLKDKLNTATNLIGLALGIACCILILIFVNNELSFDQFHKNSDRIYRATKQFPETLQIYLMTQKI